MKNI
ncbi:hypothetical protein MTR67_034544 [Solanum verrucosum]|jgi:hypothetical protein